MEHFALDKPNGKLMGVCAGISRASGIDPLAVRLLAVLFTLVAGPLTILGYLLIGWLAPKA